MSITKLLLLTSCGIILSGCANLTSIHRKSGINPAGQTELIDAKQRAIVVNPVYNPLVQDHKQDIHDRIKNRRRKSNANKPITINIDSKIYERGASNSGEKTSHPMYRMCSEAAPDVFSAYAFSAAAKAAAETNGTEKSASGMFGLSSAETAATIERTQTINMLRESMFRTCERWMNGALSERQMNIQTARDQRMMVATLAIEQLTGVVKRQPTVLSTKAVAAIGGNADELVKQLVAAEKATIDAKEEHTKAVGVKEAAKKDYTDINVKPTKLPDGYDKKSCDVLLADEPDKYAAKIAKANADSGKCVLLRGAKVKKSAAVEEKKGLLTNERSTLTTAQAEYKSLNKITAPATQGACDILLGKPPEVTDKPVVAPAVTQAETPPVVAPTKKQCKEQDDIIKAAPGNIETAKGNVTVAETEQAKADKDYDKYNTVPKVMPDDVNFRKSCDVLADTTATEVEKSLVGASPTKEQCDTLKSKVATAQTNEDAAKKVWDEKDTQETTIRRQYEAQTSMFLSAQGGGYGDPGNDPSSAVRMAVVVGTIDKITDRAFSDQSEIVFSCMQDMRIVGIDAGYKAACLDMIQKQFAANDRKSRSAPSAATILHGYGLSRSDTISLLAESMQRAEAVNRKTPDLVSCLSDISKTSKFTNAVLGVLSRSGFKKVPITEENKKSELKRKLSSKNLFNVLEQACK